MNFLITAGITLVVSLFSFVGAYQYLPLSFFEPTQQNLGATITTIAGSDTLSSSRAVINTNFSNLNTGKFELSDWYATTSATQLTTLGTIVTGVWSGTEILVTKGGTGSTTLSSNQVLLGNGTGNVGVVAGLGSSGQFLTSGGAGTPPTWTTSAVDQAAAYTWTGLHAFNNASTTFNTVEYGWPSVQNASSTVLAKSATGQLSWNKTSLVMIQDSTTYNLSDGTTGTTTMKTFTIPASAIGTNGSIRFEVFFTSAGIGGRQFGGIALGNGTASTTLGIVSLNENGTPGSTPFDGSITGTIRNINSASSQSSYGIGVSRATNLNQKPTNMATTTAVNTGAAFYISILGNLVSGADTMTAQGFTLETIQ